MLRSMKKSFFNNIHQQFFKQLIMWTFPQPAFLTASVERYRLAAVADWGMDSIEFFHNMNSQDLQKIDARLFLIFPKNKKNSITVIGCKLPDYNIATMSLTTYI